MRKMVLAIALLIAANSAAQSQTKYCSGFVPGNWRAHFPVGPNWTANQCVDLLRRGLGATDFQLFCQDDNGNWRSGDSFQGNPGNNNLPPPPNGNFCGWRL
jgi:hypothetical protein